MAALRKTAFNTLRKRYRVKPQAAPSAQEPESCAWKERVAVLTRESNKAYLIALRVTNSTAAAEEAVQEAYVDLLQHPLNDQNEPPTLTYLLKTVRSRAIDQCRKTQNRKRRELEYAARREYAQPGPDGEIESMEFAHAARSALNELPREEREALSLCCEQDLTRKAAAEVLEIPETTLTDRVQRGLEKLRLRLTALGFAGSTPLLIGESLRRLGVPPVPGRLLRAIGKLGARTAHPVHYAKVKAASAAKAAAMPGAGAKIAMAVVLASAAAGAVVYAPRSTTPVVPLPAKAAPPVAPLPALQPANSVPETRLLHLDFEDGRALPDQVGKIAKGPERAGNRLCLAGEFVPENNLTLCRVGDKDKGLFTYRDGMLLTFDYWTEAKVPIVELHLWDRTQQASLGGVKLSGPRLVKEKWSHAAVRLADLSFGANGTEHLRDGDWVVDLNIQTGGGGGGGILFVDNIETVIPPAK